MDNQVDRSITAENYAFFLAGEESTNQCTSFCPFIRNDYRLTRCDVGQVTSIDTLPDDVLLEIFNSIEYDGLDPWYSGEGAEAWQSLVHVCRRWRTLVFGSPRHLELQLFCTGRTRVRDMLDIWPVLPLIIWCNGYSRGSVDNIIAGLQRGDRVCKIHLSEFRSSDFEVLFAEMQKPFPELTHLHLWSTDKVVPVDPDSFLGGSAPHLQHLVLDGFQFPGLPKLLLSTTHLVQLYLFDIPHSGYISPDAMVTILSTLTSLEHLSLEFHSPRSCPDWVSRRPLPSTRSVLPVLIYFRFKGVNEYLEDLMACFDTPRLNDMDVTFFNDIIFDTLQLVQFINHTPTSGVLEKAHIVFRVNRTIARFSSHTPGHGRFQAEILCRGMDWQASFLKQLCTSRLRPLSMSQDLYIYEVEALADWKDSIENRLWLELLHPFTAVKNLYLSKELARLIGPALQELVEDRMTVVLPALRNIFLGGLETSGHVLEGIGKFVAGRQSTSYPLAISPWTDAERVISQEYNYR